MGPIVRRGCDGLQACDSTRDAAGIGRTDAERADVTTPSLRTGRALVADLTAAVDAADRLGIALVQVPDRRLGRRLHEELPADHRVYDIGGGELVCVGG